MLAYCYLLFVLVQIVGTNSEEQQKMFGRHFEIEDELVSHISRRSIDVLKTNYRVSDWIPHNFLFLMDHIALCSVLWLLTCRMNWTWKNGSWLWNWRIFSRYNEDASVRAEMLCGIFSSIGWILKRMVYGQWPIQVGTLRNFNWYVSRVISILVRWPVQNFRQYRPIKYDFDDLRGKAMERVVLPVIWLVFLSEIYLKRDFNGSWGTLIIKIWYVKFYSLIEKWKLTAISSHPLTQYSHHEKT